MKQYKIIFIIKTIVFIFIVISTTFWPICPPAFFRCLSNSGTMDSIKDVVRSSMKVPEFDKYLKMARRLIGRNIVEIAIKMKTLNDKIIKLHLRNLDN